MKWAFARGFVHLDFSYHWRAVAAIVVNSEEACIWVFGKPAIAIFKNVNLPVWAHFHIHQSVELGSSHEGFHFIVIPILLHGHHLDPASDPIVDEELAIVILRHT